MGALPIKPESPRTAVVRQRGAWDRCDGSAFLMSDTPHIGVQRDTLNIETVAVRLGINRSTAYELARRDELPVPVIRLGRRMVVSRHALDALLNATNEAGKGQSA